MNRLTPPNSELVDRIGYDFYRRYDRCWNMENGERMAMIALLSLVKPECSIEIGTREGGSLVPIAEHSGKVFTLDIRYSDAEKWNVSLFGVAAIAIVGGLVVTRLVETFGRPRPIVEQPEEPLDISETGGWTTGYYHTWAQTTVPDGTLVQEGAYLGRIGTQLPCGGRASGGQRWRTHRPGRGRRARLGGGEAAQGERSHGHRQGAGAPDEKSGARP